MTSQVADEKSQKQSEPAIPKAYLFEKKWNDDRLPTITLYLYCASSDTARISKILDQYKVETYGNITLSELATFRIKESCWPVVRTLGFTEFATEAEKIKMLKSMKEQATPERRR